MPTSQHAKKRQQSAHLIHPEPRLQPRKIHLKVDAVVKLRRSWHEQKGSYQDFTNHKANICAEDGKTKAKRGEKGTRDGRYAGFVDGKRCV